MTSFPIEKKHTTCRKECEDRKAEFGFAKDYIAGRLQEAEQAVEYYEVKKKKIKVERFSHLRQNKSGVWVSPEGTKMVWFKDPEGNLLSLTES